MPTRKPKRTNWRQRALMFEKLSKEYKARAECRGEAIKRLSETRDKLANELRSAERHNAELLKEREAREERLKLLATDYETYCRENPDPEPFWLRRNWVELTVMATVLGAIAFVVWRAWH